MHRLGSLARLFRPAWALLSLASWTVAARAQDGAWQAFQPFARRAGGAIAIYDPAGDRFVLPLQYVAPNLEVTQLTLGSEARHSLLPAVGKPPSYGFAAAVYDSAGRRVLAFFRSGGSFTAWELSLEGIPIWSEIPATGPRPQRRATPRQRCRPSSTPSAAAFSCTAPTRWTTLAISGRFPRDHLRPGAVSIPPGVLPSF